MYSKKNISLVLTDTNEWPFLVMWANKHKIGRFKQTKKKVSKESALNILQDKSRNIFSIHNDGSVVGAVEIYNIDYINRSCYLSLIFDEDSEFRACGEYALGLALKHIFCRLNLYRVSSTIKLSDEDSISLFKKMGFETELVRKAHLYENGEHKTILEMGTLKPIFENNGR